MGIRVVTGTIDRIVKDMHITVDDILPAPVGP